MSEIEKLYNGASELAEEAFRPKTEEELELSLKDLPEDLKPLLILLGLHGNFVYLDIFEIIAKKIDPDWSHFKIKRFTDILCQKKLLIGKEKNIFECHPALADYLMSKIIKTQFEEVTFLYIKTFVEVIAGRADELAYKY